MATVRDDNTPPFVMDPPFTHATFYLPWDRPQQSKYGQCKRDELVWQRIKDTIRGDFYRAILKATKGCEVMGAVKASMFSIFSAYIYVRSMETLFFL